MAHLRFTFVPTDIFNYFFWDVQYMFRSLIFSSVNAWVVYKELQRKPRSSFLDFLSEVAESLIAKGQRRNPIKRRSNIGRPSKQLNMENVGSHLPVEGKTRRRCVGCARKGKEKRTKTLCKRCDLPYCKDCFAPTMSSVDQCQLEICTINCWTCI